MSDPWQHRSTGMKCKSCMWFIIKLSAGQGLAPVATPINEKEQKVTNNLGRCRKHAPTLNGYPAVFVDDWCGDHKLDENKIE